MRISNVLDAKLLQFKELGTHAVSVLTSIIVMLVNLTKITNMLSLKSVDQNKLHHTFFATMRTES